MTTEENTSHMPILQPKLKITKGNIQQEPYTQSLPLSLILNDSTRTKLFNTNMPEPSTITGEEPGLSSTQNQWEQGQAKDLSSRICLDSAVA